MSSTDPNAAGHLGAHHDGADFHTESRAHLEKRTLRKGSAGWVLPAQQLS